MSRVISRALHKQCQNRKYYKFTDFLIITCVNTVSKLDLKALIDDAIRTLAGKLFHAEGPTTEKPRSPNFFLDVGFNTQRVSEKQRFLADRALAGGWMSSEMYAGEEWLRVLYTVRQSLYWTRWRNFSQCHLSRRRGVTWSRYLPPYKSRAEALSSDYMRSHCRCVILTRTPLQ